MFVGKATGEQRCRAAAGIDAIGMLVGDVGAEPAALGTAADAAAGLAQAVAATAELEVRREIAGVRRVKIWITPPMASAPYRLDCGPRTISTRSICASGRSWYIARPRSALLMRTPSTSTTVWPELVPRRNSELCLPSPPALVRLMPARPRSSSCSEVAWLDSIWARSITCAGAMLSCRAIGVRVAVTRIWSSAVVSSAAWTSAGGAASTARDSIRDCSFMGTPGATHARVAKGRSREGRHAPTPQRRLRSSSAVPTASRPEASGPVSGLAAGWPGPPSRRLPCTGHSGVVAWN